MQYLRYVRTADIARYSSDKLNFEVGCLVVKRKRIKATEVKGRKDKRA